MDQQVLVWCGFVVHFRGNILKYIFLLMQVYLCNDFEIINFWVFIWMHYGENLFLIGLNSFQVLDLSWFYVSQVKDWVQNWNPFTSILFLLLIVIETMILVNDVWSHCLQVTFNYSWVKSNYWLGFNPP